MIEVEHLAVDRAGTRVLEDVTATVEAGRFVGLVGPNGAGKTTLLGAINGRLEPAAGRVAVGGDDVAGLSARELARRMATVPQDPALTFGFTVREIVEMGRHPHRPRLGVGDEGAGRVDAALERARVDHLADRAITDVSGGERQRVLLARALAQDAPVLLLDEPTASLDVRHQARTLALVRELTRSDGRTVIAAIHDLDLAARYCDELRLLHDGRIQARGAPADVLAAEHLEAAFDTPAATVPHPITAAPTVTALPDPDRDRDGRVHVVPGGGRGAAPLHALVAAGFEVTVGPVGEHDPDFAAARALELETVAAPPHTPLDAVADAAADAARRADAAVLADVDVGPTNAGALATAGAADRLVVVEERPFGERNHAGDAARARYESLREDARVVGEDGVVEAVAAELDGRVVQSQPG